jgi:hypothetical protein
MLLFALLSPIARADDEGGGISIDPDSIDLSEPGKEEITYDGGISQTDPSYVKGKPVTVSHSGGNVEVRCMDTDKLSTRMQYTVYGTAEGPMEAVGKGMGLKVGYGSVASRVPGKTSGVSRVDAMLTVNIPMGASAITVTHSGEGWARVIDCGGALKMSSGKAGLYASGSFTGVTATASGGDLKVVMDKDAVLKSTSALSAPGGNAVLQISGSQGGKLTVKGDEVSVAQTVMGTNTPTLVSGDMGVAGPSISVSAKNRAEVSSN